MFHYYSMMHYDLAGYIATLFWNQIYISKEDFDANFILLIVSGVKKQQTWV